MNNFITIITNEAGAQNKALIKHLRNCNITKWKDLNKLQLIQFKEYLTKEVATSTAHTYLAVLKAILSKYEECKTFYKDYRNILKVKNDKPLKIYITSEELERLEQLNELNELERYVRDAFIIGAFTGMRISDTKVISKENINNNYLTYVSQKTKITATIPLNDYICNKIEQVQKNKINITLAGYNKILRRLCQKAQINEQVKVYKAGKHQTGAKWQFISSHTARISFCSNLNALGASLVEISKMAGHTNTTMTERYIVQDRINLTPQALRYFHLNG